MEIKDITAKLETLSQEDYNMVVMLINRLADKPSGILETVMDGYLQKKAREREEKVEILGLIANAFTLYSDEEVLKECLEDFSSVYGERIPEWFEILYEYMSKENDNAVQMKVLSQYAKSVLKGTKNLE